MSREFTENHQMFFKHMRQCQTQYVHNEGNDNKKKETFSL